MRILGNFSISRAGTTGAIGYWLLFIVYYLFKRLTGRATRNQ
jgi:hypothetical protein